MNRNFKVGDKVEVIRGNYLRGAKGVIIRVAKYDIGAKIDGPEGVKEYNLPRSAVAKIEDGVISTKDFTYHPITKTLSTEASTIGSFFEDSIRLQSHETGNVEIFKRDRIVRDQEGDMLYAEYKPVRDIPVKVKIYND